VRFHRLATMGVAAAALLLGSPMGLAAQAPAGATARCADGTYSKAKSRQEACSAHDGIAQWYGRSAAPVAVPAGATARCGDGSYSKARSRQGACSAHDGIAQWFGPGEAERGRPVEAEPVRVPPGAAGATARCEDGTYSHAKTRSGACSTHGGVAKWIGGGAAAPAPWEATPVGAPRNATALCNDGTYSESQHRSGTCSYHGGVRRWLKEIPR
jgi:hypothetical protein